MSYKENFKNIDFSNVEGCTRINHSNEGGGKRSDLAAPIIINDTIEVQSMSDGKHYTSKRALRQSYREQGVIEMGDQRPKRKRVQPKDAKADIEKAFAQIT